jgi:hypothetical protein
MEGDAQQASLSATAYPRTDVEEGRRQQLRTLHDPNPATLLDDEQTPGTVARVGDGDRRIEAARHAFEVQLGENVRLRA